MKTIEYLVTLADGETKIVAVQARTINSGVRKAMDSMAMRALLIRGEFHSIGFWQVRG